jgi:ketosteroid isomerase-like protein
MAVYHHPSRAMVQDGFAALLSGDMEALRGFIADDIVLHNTGDHPLAGDYVGADKVTDLIGRMFELTDNNLAFDAYEIHADDELVLIKAVMHAQRGGRVVELNQIDLIHIGRDGKVSEAWVFPEDTESSDAFWS